MDIAVVDDEKAIREYICALIEEQQPGSRIEAYATGEELLASGKRFDIVFLDIRNGSSGALVSMDTTDFHIEGKEGSWLSFDSIIIDGRQFFLMEHESYGKEAAWIVLDEDGKLIVDNVYQGFDQTVLQQIKDCIEGGEEQNYSFIDGNKNNCRKKSSRASVLKKLWQKQAEIAKRSGKPVQQMETMADMERRRK